MSLFFQFFPLLVVLVVIFFIPSLIVLLWKKRPALAFIIASLIMLATFFVLRLMVAINIASAFSDDDPQLMAGGISEAIVGALLSMVFFGPILWIFQWFILRRHRKKMFKVDTDKTFS